MKENKIKIIIYLVLVAVFVGIGILFVYLTRKPENFDDVHDPITENYNIQDVYDINEYQMVYTSMSNYYHMRNDEPENLIDLLFDDYKTKNHITINNIDNFVEKKYDYYNYTITNLTKYSNPYYAIYYISGKYSLEELDTTVEESIVKDILIMDTINNSYAILPLLNMDYNKTFNDLIHTYSLENFNQEIKINEHNEVQYITINEFNEANMYYNEYINLLMNNCKEAYNLVGNETKNTYKTVEEFQTVCSFYTVTPSIAQYSIESTNEGKSIGITDTYGHRYNFVLESVKKYKVDILK